MLEMSSPTNSSSGPSRVSISGSLSSSFQNMPRNVRSTRRSSARPRRVSESRRSSRSRSFWVAGGIWCRSDAGSRSRMASVRLVIRSPAFSLAIISTSQSSRASRLDPPPDASPAALRRTVFDRQRIWPVATTGSRVRVGAEAAALGVEEVEPIVAAAQHRRTPSCSDRAALAMLC